MLTAIVSLDRPMGLSPSALAALAHQAGIGAVLWETNSHRLRLRFDETLLTPEDLMVRLRQAGCAVRQLIVAGGDPIGQAQPWFELDGPPGDG